MTTEIVSVEFLVANGFRLEQYTDGKYWLLRVENDDVFLQLNEDRSKADLYQKGWIDNNLSYKEVTLAVEQIKAINQQ